LGVKIDAAWDVNRKLYGPQKIWHVLRLEGEDVARCTVERLMRSLRVRGEVRGKKIVTTNPDTSLPCPDDIGVLQEAKAPLVNRMFLADRGVAYLDIDEDAVRARRTGSGNLAEKDAR
jgi:transposase InsO family protein